MRSKPLILLALCLAAFTINLDTTIVNVALPSLVRELEATNSELQWIVDAYNLVFAALLLAAGSVADRVGRKGVLLAGLAVFGTATAVGGFAEDPGELIVARAVMGIGAAMVFPATLSIVSNVFTERVERARAISLWVATSGAAVALGPLAGGWLIERFGWPSVFFAMAPVAAVAAGFVAVSAPASRDPDAPRTDWAGFALSTAAMGLLIFTIIEAPDDGWTSSATLTGFVAAGFVLAAFVVWEQRAATPMLDISLFRNPRFTAGSAAITVGFFALFGFIFMVTQYFQFLKGWGPFEMGARLLPLATSIAVSSVLGARLAVRIGSKVTVTAGLLALAAFYFWTTTIATDTSYTTLALSMVLFGVGLGLAAATATEAIMGAVPEAKAGVGSAVNDATRLLGGTLGVAIIGSVYASLYESRIRELLPRGLPGDAAAEAHDSVGAALGLAQRLAESGQAPLAAAVHDAASTAFFSGQHAGGWVAAGVVAGGALSALLFLPAHPVERASGADVGQGPVPASSTPPPASVD